MSFNYHELKIACKSQQQEEGRKKQALLFYFCLFASLLVSILISHAKSIHK